MLLLFRAKFSEFASQPASSGLRELVEKLPRYDARVKDYGPGAGGWSAVLQPRPDGDLVKFGDVLAALRAATEVGDK